ncbi:hypothetical protein EBZ39_00115 [bacterium]|nr:hypothetical protein [bacterium]
MGWNDRLFEDPYWPEVSREDDRDSYENWLQYLENQLEDVNAELSSQNLAPEDLRRLAGIRKASAAEQEFARRTQFNDTEEIHADQEKNQTEKQNN